MATIRARRQTDGSIRYTAIVRIRRGKTIVHREYKTFALRTAAASWARHREAALEQPGALTRISHGVPTLAELIRWYIDNFESVSKWQRSKQAHLHFLERHALGKLNALNLTSIDLIDHVRFRRANGTGPATVANDLIWLGVVLRAAKNVKGLPVQPDIVQEAREACAELRLTGKARKRSSRPTPAELAQLRDYFARRDKRSSIPMQAVVEFALNSARRETEICRLEWRDNDLRNRTGMVRDAKHPTRKEGNHRADEAKRIACIANQRYIFGSVPASQTETLTSAAPDDVLAEVTVTATSILSCDLRGGSDASFDNFGFFTRDPGFRRLGGHCIERRDLQDNLKRAVRVVTGRVEYCALGQASQ